MQILDCRLQISDLKTHAQPALRPPLKWAGGKRWLVPRLAEIWTQHRHRRLVEPFCGGLGMVLGLNPASSLLNDVNPHVINFYRWLQRGLTISFPMANTPQRYYALRKRFNTLLAADESGSSEAAGIFYYLNRTGYNGLCRFNSHGEFNVPFGRYKNLVYRRQFPEYAEGFARMTFTAGDFESLELAPDDFIYADPPYDVQFRHTPGAASTGTNRCVRLSGWRDIRGPWSCRTRPQTESWRFTRSLATTSVRSKARG